MLADADLVAEVFLNQNKLHAFRRSFPMSKLSDDPNADVFLANGLKWIRMRYGLEKVMLNNKNIARCLQYLNESFSLVFSKKNISAASRKDQVGGGNSTFDIYKHAKLLMIQSMFLVVFGTSLNEFVAQEPRLAEKAKKTSTQYGPTSDLFQTQLVAHKFHAAFVNYESFSLLKFSALMVPELSAVWRFVERAKAFVNARLFFCRLDSLADPMDFFYEAFIYKYLMYCRIFILRDSGK